MADYVKHLKSELDQAEKELAHYQATMNHRRKAELIRKLMDNVAGAKALRKHFQRKNKDLDYPDSLREEALQNLTHQIGVNAMLRGRISELSTTVWNLKNALAALEAAGVDVK